MEIFITLANLLVRDFAIYGVNVCMAQLERGVGGGDRCGEGEKSRGG